MIRRRSCRVANEMDSSIQLGVLRSEKILGVKNDRKVPVRAYCTNRHTFFGTLAVHSEVLEVTGLRNDYEGGANTPSSGKTPRSRRRFASLSSSETRSSSSCLSFLVCCGPFSAGCTISLNSSSL